MCRGALAGEGLWNHSEEVCDHESCQLWSRQIHEQQEVADVENILRLLIYFSVDHSSPGNRFATLWTLRSQDHGLSVRH